MKKIYFVGIKGVGMTPLAILLKEAGHQVKGSDVQTEFITDQALKKAGIEVMKGFNAENVEKYFSTQEPDNCLLIFSASHEGASNTEVTTAEKMNISAVSLGKALGMLTRGQLFTEKKTTISVTGTHGKTTTAAMLAHVLTDLGEDPSYIIGSSDVYPLGAPGHYGKGEYLVAEADEYVSSLDGEKTSKFLEQSPQFALITNIDFDHPDVFKDLSDVKKSFDKFAQLVPSNGFIVTNADDNNSAEVVTSSGKKFITFGEGAQADFRSTQISQNVSGTEFEIVYGTQKQKIKLSLSGLHNVSNTTAVFAMLVALKSDPQKIADSLAKFKGTKRRGEIVGRTGGGALVIDDYAHHPKEITTTLSGLAGKYNKKIVCIFQPHTYSRTQAFLQEFADSFEHANELILLPIFSSAREHKNEGLTEKDYIKAFRKANPNAHFLPTHDAVIKYLSERKLDKNYIIITMGAGDVYKIGQRLVSKSRK